MAEGLRTQRLTDSYALIDQATRLYHRAVQIHPFQYGNGRSARFLSNIWLRQHGSPVVLWPEETVGAASTIRDEYLDAIRRTDQFDLGPLTKLHRRFLER
jgi:fido (protein-threonine AMPylation protein)